MRDKIIVFVTCETKEQAEQIAETVVQEKLVACVNLVPGVRSCYVWAGELTWSDEVMCLMKTTSEKFDALRDKVKSLHSYSVPEIVAVRMEDVDRPYADWIDESLA